ncbi:MAG TPA: endonuclease/exonuclease/phosphatase family protein [Candidatus Binatia bacterium]|nr:endonuclease/exonuclease/phosphatase family protein [Candidatus Binatia bacterium]
MKKANSVLAAAALACLSAQAHADIIPVLTYNVRGLPPQVIEPRATQIAAIAGKLEDFHTTGGEFVGGDSLVGLQELFDPNYYNTIMSGVAYDVETAKDSGGPAGIGDGLDFLSDYPLTAVTQVGWTNCFGTFGANGSDCDTNKGFTVGTAELVEGGSVKIINLHADAGQDEGSRTARRANITQLVTYINDNLEGEAIILMGDTNSLFTRAGNDNVQTLITSAGLSDVWVELKRGGEVPGAGTAIDTGCAADEAGANCERIDKIMYRSSDTVSIVPVDYQVLDDFFDDSQGGDLSDHKPVYAEFDVNLIIDTSTSSSTTSSSTTTTEAPSGDCGDPAPPSGNVTASDALFVLRTAVGSLSCEVCVCDASGNGSITASDALLILKAAVGQDVDLACPAC